MARKAVNELFTIGFTEKSAEDFFSRLRAAGAKRVIDVRLNNVSQLAGFSKRDDLRFFLQEIAGIGYIHLPLLAPTQEMLEQGPARAKRAGMYMSASSIACWKSERSSGKFHPI